MEKNNKTLTILLILFILISLGLTGYIVYDKLLKEETEDTPINETINNNENNNQEENNELYNYADFENRVYLSDIQSYGMTLWANNICSYYTSEGINYIGTYSIDNDTITVNVVTGTNKEREDVVPTQKTILTFKIQDEIHLLDTENNITLTRANRPSREGGFPRETFK